MSAALALIGGSKAYELLSGRSFGDPGKTTVVDTPFGKSAPIHLFKGDGYFYYFLSRHGDKGYDIAASSVNYRANLFALKELGVERIVSWSQPGAIAANMRPGDFVVPDDVIDNTRTRATSYYSGTGLGFIRMGEPFCPEASAALTLSTVGCGVPLHEKGIYICVEGPRLETPSEIRMFASWGADMVGMTIVPEMFLARELEICYSCICLISNYAEGVVPREFKEGVLFEGMANDAEKEKVDSGVSMLPEIVAGALMRLSRVKRNCSCGKSMERYRREGKIEGDLLATIRSITKKTNQG